MKTEDAEEYTQALALSGAGWWRQRALALRMGVHEALGLTPEAWNERLGGHVRLAITERREAVAELTGGEEPLTNRQAAAVLGVDESTIRADRRAGNPAPAPAQQDESQVEPEPEREPAGNPAEEPELTLAPATPKPEPVMLTLRTHTGDEVPYPKPQGKATFNLTEGDGISWAAWSWNPVTGCLHGCDYCYAREIATSGRFKDGFPAGFTPLYHPERLDAPANTTIPRQYRDDTHACGDGDCKVCAHRRVFVCSMADLYGRWVPDEWIQQVHGSMLASPDWEYLLLTKFPGRYVGLDLPKNAWVGTSVDEQKRVRLAEDAFRQIEGVKVKWLSLEPLREPLEFTDLSMFDWVVIGAQTSTNQPDGPVAGFQPPFEWWARIYVQAKDAGCRVHFKPNLLRNVDWPDEYPTFEAEEGGR